MEILPAVRAERPHYWNICGMNRRMPFNAACIVEGLLHKHRKSKTGTWENRIKWVSGRHRRMDFSGIVIGAISFLSIGIFHPIVIKAEYYFSKSCWPVFLAAGTVLMALSTQIHHTVLSAGTAGVGMSCWWSIVELYEQEKRVKRGWFPANPKRKAKEKESGRK